MSYLINLLPAARLGATLLALLWASPVAAQSPDANALPDLPSGEMAEHQLLEQPASIGASRAVPERPLVRVISSLGIVMGLLLAGIWLVRSGGGSRTPDRGGSMVRVLGRVRLSPKYHASVVQFGDDVLLLGDGPTGLQTLAHISDPAKTARLLAQPGVPYQPAEHELRSWMQREKLART